MFPELRAYSKREEKERVKGKKPKTAAADFEYIGIEAGIACGYNLGEWMREDAQVKGRAIAHYMERNLRDGHAHEVARAEAKKEQDAPQGDYLEGLTKFSQV